MASVRAAKRCSASWMARSASGAVADGDGVCNMADSLMRQPDHWRTRIGRRQHARATRASSTVGNETLRVMHFSFAVAIFASLCILYRVWHDSDAFCAIAAMPHPCLNHFAHGREVGFWIVSNVGLHFLPLDCQLFQRAIALSMSAGCVRLSPRHARRLTLSWIAEQLASTVSKVGCSTGSSPSCSMAA